MSIYVSIAALALSIFLCMKPSATFFRIYFAFGVLAWGAFVLTFYMNALIRVAARQTGSPKSTDAFNAGILAYNDLLWECRFSLGLLLTALAILVFFPAYAKGRIVSDPLQETRAK